MIKLKELLENKYKIFVDMDGVLTDFVKQFNSIGVGDSYTYEDQHGTEAFWNVIDKSGLRWWSEMPWMDDGKKLWNYVKNMDVHILSAPAKRLPQSRKGKMGWVKKQLGNVDLILKDADKKQQYAKPNTILIDDLVTNIKQWNSKGGIGILHKSAQSTIKKLQNLGL